MGWVLITGASRGLGFALAQEAAQAGHDLILSDVDAPALAKAAEALPGTAVQIVADLASPGGAAQLWAEASAGREIDILVNNAGLGRHGAMGSAAGGGTARDVALVQVNIAALTELMGLALEQMRARGRGRILNVASIAAWMPAPYLASYHASKSYVLFLSRAVRHELRGTGVSVTALCPGPMATGFFDDAGATNVYVTRVLRPMDPARVARAGWAALEAGRAVCIPGALNWVAAMVSHLSPKAVNAPVSGWLWKPRDKG